MNEFSDWGLEPRSGSSGFIQFDNTRKVSFS